MSAKIPKHILEHIDDLKREIARLRAVLEPIAEVAEDIPDHWPNSYQCVTMAGHFRAARIALEATR